MITRKDWYQSLDDSQIIYQVECHIGCWIESVVKWKFLKLLLENR